MSALLPEVNKSKANTFGLAPKMVKDVLMMILPYLNLNDLAKCEIVNVEWNLLLRGSFVWKNIVYDNKTKLNDDKLFQLWLTKKIKFHSPERLVFFDSKSLWSVASVMDLFSEINPRLRKLNIFFDCENEVKSDILMKSIIKSCPNLKSFKTQGKFLSDRNLVFLSEVKQLEVLCIYNDDIAFEGQHLSKLPPLRKIYFRPHNIEFNKMESLIRNSGPFLEKIALDCENLSTEDVYAMLDKLSPEKMKKLILFYCEEMDDGVFALLSKFKCLRKLNFHKGLNISGKCFISSFSSMNFENLFSLHLTEANNLNDEALKIVCNNSPLLQKISLEWCTEVGHDAISYLFRKCLFIKKCNFQGMKKLNEKAFPIFCDLIPGFNQETYRVLKNSGKLVPDLSKYFENGALPREAIPFYRYLRVLNLQKCDFINDAVLFIMKVYFQHIEILNYYGEGV